jgi:hypothetical protein
MFMDWKESQDTHWNVTTQQFRVEQKKKHLQNVVH